MIIKFLFNASKSQLLYFSKKDDPMHVMRPILRMSHGQIVPYVEKCIHLGNTLSTSSTEHALIDSAITDLNIKTNNLLSEFSFSESTTLSRLFQSYCMNVYGSSLLGYEPASLTVHPPPRMIEGGFIFFVWVSSATKIFSSKKKWIL